MATHSFARSITRPEALELGDGTRTLATPRTAAGSSRRHFCRIYPDRGRWMLRVDPSGWEMSALVKSFATLNAAIAYALAHDFSYRVFHLSEGETQWVPTLALGAAWHDSYTDRPST
jgi:hypothetical protein